MFISPKVIYADLARVYKNMSFNYGDIVEWCMRVETEHIGDVDIMWKFRFAVKVNQGRITLPNNVYRVLSVRTKKGTDIKYPAISSIYIHGLSAYENEVMMVEFLGVPVDDDCMPLIAASHREACNHYCIMNIIRPEALNDFNKFRMLEAMEERFNGMVTSVRQGFREWTEGDIERLSLHSYNEVFKGVYAKYYQYNSPGYHKVKFPEKQKVELIDSTDPYTGDDVRTVLEDVSNKIEIIKE